MVGEVLLQVINGYLHPIFGSGIAVNVDSKHSFHLQLVLTLVNLRVELAQGELKGVVNRKRVLFPLFYNFGD